MKNRTYITDIVIVVLAATLVSIVSWLYYSRSGLVLAYGDAESHLNIAKRVVDSITPGLGQLGGNWLPLQHILMLPFIWVDKLWWNGFAGSIVSMISYILSVMYIYKTGKILSDSKLVGFVSCIIFGLNPSILYLQSTPMSELPLLATFVGTVYHFTRWTKTESPLDIVAAGFLSFAGTLMRYDAWFLTIFVAASIILTLIIKRKRYQKIEGTILLFGSIASLGMIIWFVWNYLIFNNPLYFLNGEYSAHSQQMSFLERGELLSYHDLAYSTKLYSYVTSNIASYGLTIMAIIGLIMMVANSLIHRKLINLTSSLIYLVPFIFYVVTLYLGISIILVPALVPDTFQFKMFNVRYGVMMIPAISIFSALILDVKNIIYKFFVTTTLLIMVLFAHRSESIVVVDGTRGLSARKAYNGSDSLVGSYVPKILSEVDQSNKYIAINYDYGLIMFDDYSRPLNPIDIKVPMKNILYIGNHPIWDYSLGNPSEYVRWVVVRENNTDMMWGILKENYDFNSNFTRQISYGDISIYKSKK